MAETTGRVSNEKDTVKTASQISPPVINLPKGGGAIRGMGEKFAANPVTGTGSMTVPIATSPGRSGFGPQLSLSYDSGAGNGPFGFGWSLSLPSITRKTDKGLPKYEDSEESDVFILSGAEDLVPVYEKDASGNWVFKDGKYVIHDKLRTVDGVTYNVRRYRPRIEGLFARIERWTKQEKPEDTFWRSISKDNITTWYGKTDESRISDANDKSHIFSWLICQSYDDKGNVVVYGYKAENSAKVFEDSSGKSVTKAHERNRTDQSRSAQRYLKRIRYGNRKPYLPELKEKDNEPWPEPPGASDEEGSEHWLFEVVFDYDEPHYREQAPDAEGRIFATASAKVPQNVNWPVRNDPFSAYRAGFEVRTYRLCQRVLMFHHFPGEKNVGADCLVRSTDFNYECEAEPRSACVPIYSFLTSVTPSGYVRQGDQYLKKSLPPVEFTYSKPEVQDLLEEVDLESVENLPVGLDGSSYRWTDLHGEGIPGILTEQAGTWYYKRNWSPVLTKLPDGSEAVKAKFSALETVALKPNVALSRGAEFMDLAGDGQPDFVMLEGPTPGLFEHDEAEGWDPFRPFTAHLKRSMHDPNLKLVDLDGDGHADVFITEDDAFVWHPSLAEEGFGSARRVAQALDEEQGPRLVFADGTQSIYLADLSGDGLTDLVRIRNGEVCYWPNLGYAKFGAKVTMDNAPWFDNPDQFDQKRIRLADIDGSGTTDIIYLHRDGVRLYFNQSGNSWSQPQQLSVFPKIDNLSSIVPTDLLGNGTACLVWSSPLTGDARRPMRYVNLMGGQKPHLLVKTRNNLGAETHVEYAPSTKFYLQDKLAGTPWITRLPFPVHVVERVETYDHISRNRFVTRYAYHQGYFDGEEREFRGFGMVEQWDTEQFAVLAGGNVPADNIAAESHVPPVLTKTWFHTGVYDEVEEVSQHCAAEYYGAPDKSAPNYKAAFEAFLQTLLLDTVIPPEVTLDEEREACRALKGSMLRQEVYALDGTDKEKHPYTVTEQNFTIRKLQARGSNRHGVFFTHARESISYHYERYPDDPRIQHAMTLEADNYGNVLKSLAIGYGRRPGLSPLQGDDKTKQEQLLITYTESDVTHAIDDTLKNPDGSVKYPADYRTPLPSDIRTYELTGMTPENRARRFSFGELTRDAFVKITGLIEEQYEWDVDYTAPRKRLIEHVRTLYRPDDCGAAQNDPLALLPPRVIEPRALPGESYKQAFTPGLAKQIYVESGKLSQTDLDSVLAYEGKYVHGQGDANWWIPSGRVFYSAGSNDTAASELAEAKAHFFLARRYRDPFSYDSFVVYDEYDLLMQETRDALDNRVTVGERDGNNNLTIKGNDYRVLQPRLVSDPNRNRTEVAFDALGMVAGTAVMGKPEEGLGDNLDGFVANLTETKIDAFFEADDPHAVAHELLNTATMRIIYDLNRFQDSRTRQPEDPSQWDPVFAATLARETHVADLNGQQTKIQISFSYSDGFGREIQKKIQAEPGKVEVEDNASNIIMVDTMPNIRWVGSGWTIFNNKGKPVRQYEPFFSINHRFQFGKKVGVSLVLFYDPIERVIATLHPNHTYEKVVFDPWQQTTYDVNDTCAPLDEQTGDPRTDPDIGGYVADYFKTQSTDWKTWYQQRQEGSLGPAEKAAADKAAVHADTPTIAHFDALGRPFFTVAHNRFSQNGIVIDQQYPTRVKLDIEGNQREVIDALGRIVMRYDYSIAGPEQSEDATTTSRIHQSSMDAGERWTLNDVTGKPIRSWDSRGFQRRMTYDELRRPTGLYVIENGMEPRLAERTIYGESQGDTRNHRTRVYQAFDGAGIVTSVAYDFKGNVLESRRDLLPDYTEAVNWDHNPTANDGSFTSRTTYDALNRPVTLTTPHTLDMQPNIIRPSYNEANLLDKIDVNLRGATETTPFVRNINYNAKGQRELIEYGCGKGFDTDGVTTTYKYDENTFRLIHLKTTRPKGLNGIASEIFNDPTVVQDLHYTYDPAGNITRIGDTALKTVYYNNEQVQQVCSYVYDAVYRLIEATGREHIDQSAFQFSPPDCNYRDYPFVRSSQINDLQALRNYTERYEYDDVGNFKHFIHRVANDRWTRAYEYNETSLIEDGTGTSAHKASNRLSRTILQPGSAQPISEPYSYDAHGSTTMMPHLPLMQWDFEDQLSATSKQVTNTCPRETTFYVYDAAGQRVRKVTERQNGTRKDERIYLGGFEIYREYNPSTGSGQAISLERETLHVMDDQQRIALVETKTIDAQSSALSPQSLIRYQLGNHLGSASLELAEDGALISYEEYHPYGTTAFQAGRSAAELSLKRYRYTGKERDEETGFNYHGARYYAPWFARWISCDPTGMQEGSGLYTYSSNNSVRYIDPNGTQLGESPNIIFTDKDIAAHPNAHVVTVDLTGNSSRGEEKASIPTAHNSGVAERGGAPATPKETTASNVARAADVSGGVLQLVQDMLAKWRLGNMSRLLRETLQFALRDPLLGKLLRGESHVPEKRGRKRKEFLRQVRRRTERVEEAVWRGYRRSVLAGRVASRLGRGIDVVGIVADMYDQYDKSVSKTEFFRRYETFGAGLVSFLSGRFLPYHTAGDALLGSPISDFLNTGIRFETAVKESFFTGDDRALQLFSRRAREGQEGEAWRAIDKILSGNDPIEALAELLRKKSPSVPPMKTPIGPWRARGHW